MSTLDSSPCSQGKHQNEERSYAVRREDDDDDTTHTQTQTFDWKDVYTQGYVRMYVHTFFNYLTSIK